jgi:hypothetical protein
VAQCEPYTALVSVTDPVSGLINITYCGLETTLSQVVKALPAEGAQSIAVFADTLVIDTPTLTTSGLILVVRSLDISALQGKPLVLISGTNGEIVAQVLVGSVVGGTFTLASAGHESAGQNPAISASILSASLYHATGGGALGPLPSGGLAAIQDLLNKTLALNTLQSSFAAAAWLMDNRSSEAATVQSMLAWVVTCTGALSSNQALPSNVAQLYSQAAALLVSVNVAAGATFVPVLAGQYYSDHMNDIISIIQDYEGNLTALDTQQDIAQAIATVSSSLQGVANDEAAPLQVQLSNISTNVDSLYNDISALRNQFILQNQRAHTAFLVLGDKQSIAAIYKQLKTELDMAMSAISFSFGAVKAAADQPIDGLQQMVESSVEGIKALVETIQAGQGGGEASDLSTEAMNLLKTQSAIMKTVLNSRVLYQQALVNQSGATLPASLAGVTMDPATDWDNYVASAEAELNELIRDESSDVAAAAASYLASVKILASYGKAIGTKFVVYVSQLVQASVVMAQIQAAKNVDARWRATVAQATSDAERLAALKALIQGRLLATKRSLFVSWTYYAASYFYLSFKQPPRVINLGMNAAALKAALVGVSEWIAAAIGNAPDGTHVQLPNNHAQIELDFPILAAGSSATGDYAALLNGNAQDGWSLAFSVPLGTKQLDGVLPNQGKCAIWISQAQFFLDNVTPNSKGNVIATVCTAGSYQNGFGPGQAYAFVTQGLSGDYAYQCKDNTVYSPWQINTAVYMTPTPYTTWQMTLAPGCGDPSTATLLRVKLTIAYLSAPTQ